MGIFEKIKKDYKSFLYVILIAAVFVQTYRFGIQKGMQQVIGSGYGRHIVGMAIAISELRYGLTGSRYYNTVADPFVKERAGKGIPPVSEMKKITDGSLGAMLNAAIAEAINIPDASKGGISYLPYEDKGISSYYKMAFRIFGYRIESFYYLYFLFLLTSLVVFIVTFYRRYDLLNMLLLFMCGQLVIVKAAPIVGLNLLTVHNTRFLPVLAIVPAFYLALLIFGKGRLTKWTVLGACVQTYILMLMIYVRSGTVYQVMFLSALFCLSAGWVFYKNRAYGIYVFNKIRFWPLAIVLLGVFFLKMHTVIHFDSQYDDDTSQHTFWFPLYLGLGAHPESLSKYGIVFHDKIAYHLAAKIAAEKYGPSEKLENVLREQILKERYLKILREDPRYAIENYLHKLPMVFSVYFSPNFGAVFYLFDWSLILMIGIGALLSCDIFLKQWDSYFTLVSLNWVFSLLPMMIAIPQKYLMAEAGVLLTCILYMLLAKGFCLALIVIREKFYAQVPQSAH